MLLLMARKIRTVKGIVDWRLCLGCGACAFICPERKIELVDVLEEGIRPLVTNEICGTCSACLQVCPAWENDHRPLQGRPGIISELVAGFGPVLEMWEGYATDPEIRHAGSSGGALTALALYCLEREGMYGVLHIGGDPDAPLSNMTRMSHSREELLRCTGSRYAPASACDRLEMIETAPAPCVFIGQPSEVTALRKAQALRPALKAKVGVALSFFCAGSPATQGTLELLRTAGIDSEEVEEVRYRGLGWPGMFAVRCRRDATLRPFFTYQKSWGFLQKYRPFSQHLIPDGCGEDADVACGDPWYQPPSGHEEGRSLILARTELGRRLVRAAAAAGYLQLKPASPAHLIQSQINLLRKRGAVWGRVLALKMLGLPAPRLRGFSLFENWLKLSFLEKVKSIFGTLRRIVQRGYFRPNNLAARRLVKRSVPAANVAAVSR